MRIPMTALNEALAKILADAQFLDVSEQVSLEHAVGRILAQDICAEVDVPPWDNSAMDGFALRSGDSGARRISQRVIAGDWGEPLGEGEAARIFTGAPVPPGADAILIQEDARWQEDTLECLTEVNAGDNIRPRGQDIARGDKVFSRGHRLQPADLGVIASIGLHAVTVARQLTVGILSTGNELVEPGQSLAAGQIYNSNRYTLMGLLQRMGYQYRDYGIVGDDFKATCETLEQAAGECDLLISSGGVSVGEEDHVRAAVESLGSIELWKLAIKPGKPLAYGRVRGVPFFGLPGNPAAVFVTFCLTAAPYLRTLQGARSVGPAARLQLPAVFRRERPGKRQEYLRGQFSQGRGGTEVDVFDNQSSGVLSLVSQADCLVVVPVGATIEPGDLVEVLPLAALLGE